SFPLPKKYAPGTDLMSKWLLSNKDVINMIVCPIIVVNGIGAEAKDAYSAWPSEWPNFVRSDVLYFPNSSALAKKLPPVLIEVQCAAGMPFYRRLIKYCLSAEKQYSLMPVIVTFVIHSTSSELLEMASGHEQMPYILELPCQGWARSCFLLTASSIRPHLADETLNPLVALAHFLCEQKLSLGSITRQDDPTIQMLYRIAQEAFDEEAAKEESKMDCLELITKRACDQFELAKRTLIEEVPSEDSRKRT
ncbi:hypothetical protein BX666DRAFT_1811613, partial [Dichotomocladium elegans]